MVTLFIQEKNGDYNYDREYNTVEEAENDLATIIHTGWYSYEDMKEKVFIPWQSVDFARITKD